MSDETAREGTTDLEEDAAPDSTAPPEDGPREAGKREKGGVVGHRDLAAIIGIAVVLFILVAVFALVCPGAWETGQMMDDEPGQGSQETPDEIEPPE